MKKFMFYLKNSTKPVIVTEDDNTDLEALSGDIKKIFESNKIFTLGTKHDYLVIRPSELQAVLISDDEYNSDQTNHTFEKPEIKSSVKLVTKLSQPQVQASIIDKPHVVKSTPEPIKKVEEKITKISPNTPKPLSTTPIENKSSTKKIMSLEEVKRKLDQNKTNFQNEINNMSKNINISDE
jgi:PHD/YefM family antitoxin component YafN of YafNO toxin-antitoxin module